MTARITPTEVLIYLNYLGYDNINAQQLKEFIQDLKKLIKYEEHKRSGNNIQADSVCALNGTSNYVARKHDKLKENEIQHTDKFTMLHHQGTFASKAKTIFKKENIISLQIKKSKSHHHCAQHNKENVLPESVGVNNSALKAQNELKNKELSEKTSNNVNTDPSGKNKCVKSKSSFIRPPIQVNKVNNKSDPVALYQYYKAEWERRRLPGENQRTELRWAIREKMLGGPRVSRT